MTQSAPREPAPREPARRGPAPRQPRTFIYTLARVLAVFVFHIICPIKYHNAKRADLDAPFIAICNHKSWLDPVCVAYVVKRYEIRFLGKKELAANKVAGFFMRKLHMIGVSRHDFDMMAVRNCMAALKNGQILGIFPEGTRYKQGVMEQMESGVALIALRSSVPLVPFYIDGKIRLFHRTHCYVGEPILMDDLREQGVDNEVCQKLMDRITDTYKGIRGCGHELK